MTKFILTTLDNEKIVTTEERTHRAQHLHVDEALVDGLSLKEMLELDGFLDEWVALGDVEYGWGAEIEVCECDAEFTIIEE